MKIALIVMAIVLFVTVKYFEEFSGPKNQI
jgi:hypothetical protein